MLVAEYCGNCDKKTMRKTEPCPECTPKNVESQTTDTQHTHYEICPECNCEIWILRKGYSECEDCGYMLKDED